MYAYIYIYISIFVYMFIYGCLFEFYGISNFAGI